MKKRIISLILASAMLLSMISCSKKEQTLDVENMTLEEYIDKAELPKNLTISIDPATVEERETAKVYDDVKYMEFDHEKMVDLLFKNPITEEIHYPDNEDVVSYIAKTDTMEETSAIKKGCFTYFVEPEENAWGATYPDFKEMHDSSVMQAINCFRGIYQSVDKELDFTSREEIAAKATALVKDMGISEIEVQDIYAYDMDAIKAEVKYGPSNYDEETKVKKSDEHYYVFVRQLVDGIPINRYGIRTEEDGVYPSTVFALLYTEDGLKENVGIEILESPAETDGKEEPLISAAEALEHLKEYYGQGVLLKPYDVEDMELLYISERNDENENFSLRPYWLVKTSYQQDYPAEFYHDYDGNPLEGEIKAYDFNYIDAVTGEYSTKSTSGKPIE